MERCRYLERGKINEVDEISRDAARGDEAMHLEHDCKSARDELDGP